MPHGIWGILKKELAPFDGRLATAWRVAAICMLASSIFMIYQLPLVAIGCYLILFVMKPNTGESMLMGLGICVLVSIVVGIMFILMRWTIDSPMMHMVVLALSSFLFLYLGAASPLGPVGNIIALVMGFIMSLLGMVPLGEVATRALLYAWLMALVPMATLVAFCAAFGRSPLKLVRAEVAERLRAVAAVLQAGGDIGLPAPIPDAQEGTARSRLLERIREGNESIGKAMLFVQLFHLSSGKEIRLLADAIKSTYELMVAAVALPEDSVADEARERQAERCLALAAAVQAGDVRTLAVQQMAPDMEPATDPAGALEGMLAAFPLVPGAAQHKVKEPAVGFFFADALTNPEYTRFALKTTFGAIFCYLVYTALQWQDIHTAMITCYIVALGSTGETVHKLTLRIIGCLIGALLGVLSILLLMPLMTSIGELMLLVFVGILCAAWVSSGSERIAYAGVQVGLAFLLTVLQGFGPEVKLSVAMDRTIGILLGNVVMYVLFTRVWPVSAARLAERKLAAVIEATALRCSDVANGPWRLRAYADNALAQIAAAREQLVMSWFEPASVHPGHERLQSLHALADTLEQTYVEQAFPARQPKTAGAASREDAMARLAGFRQTLKMSPA